MTLILIAIAVTAINLVQTALTAGYPHSQGILSLPDMATIPKTRRYVCYLFVGIHLGTLMIGFMGATNDPPNNMNLLMIALAGTLGTALGIERRLRKQA